MSLDRVTPVILTLNEASNIGRTLANLDWARRIVVVDSFSDDATCDIARGNPRVAFFQRRFDAHAAQWNYAISETGIDTPWILALDADYQVTPEAAREIERRLDEPVAGLRARFRYCVAGRALRGTAYPPVTVLFRAGRGHYEQDGHTQRLALDGPVGDLSEPFLHDDRKPLSAWLAAQARYARLEADKLASAPFATLGAADKLRRTLVLAAPAMLVYCLFVKGNILDGRAGLFYAGQRALVELMLALYLIERGFTA